MNLLRYVGDLPEFSYEEVIWDKETLEQTCRVQTGDDILRYVKIPPSSDIGALGLSRLLEETSRSFERVMEGIGLVVPHEFGITKLPKNFATRRKAHNEGSNEYIRVVPRGYEVVAKVKVLPVLSHATSEDIAKVTQAYQKVDDMFWAWGDYKSGEQYVWSYDDVGDERLFWIDIEPRFYAFNLTRYVAYRRRQILQARATTPNDGAKVDATIAAELTGSRV